MSKFKTIITLAPAKALGCPLEFIFSYKLIKNKKDQLGLMKKFYPDKIPKNGIYVCEVALKCPVNQKLRSRVIHVKKDLSDLQPQIMGFIHTLGKEFLDNQFGEHGYSVNGNWENLVPVIKREIKK
jgi:hypothetical protein